jgi:hypothetical protein
MRERAVFEQVLELGAVERLIEDVVNRARTSG